MVAAWLVVAPVAVCVIAAMDDAWDFQDLDAPSGWDAFDLHYPDPEPCDALDFGFGFVVGDPGLDFLDRPGDALGDLSFANLQSRASGYLAAVATVAAVVGFGFVPAVGSMLNQLMLREI